MKISPSMSGLALVLSTFPLLAQPELPPELPAGPSPGIAGAPAANPAAQGTEADAEEKKKPDINEVIRTASVFTNSAGLVMKKAGGLWISAYETTQEVYEKVAGSNPSAFHGANRPVDSVTWNAATRFCKQLTAYEKEKATLPEGYVYALPTQDQWEALASAVPLSAAVTSSTTERSGTADVGTLPPSAAGLYDLRGNVAEHCMDPSDGAYRVLRGGSWKDWIDVNLRLAFRVYVAPDDAENTFGFRCVLIKGR